MNVKEHYDLLIEEGNDPVYDNERLKDYMNKWDGQIFIESMKLNKNKTVLEIGVGTGRIAVKTAPLFTAAATLRIGIKSGMSAAEIVRCCFSAEASIITEQSPCADCLLRP